VEHYHINFLETSRLKLKYFSFKEQFNQVNNPSNTFQKDTIPDL